jgi:hypothetical protein
MRPSLRALAAIRSLLCAALAAPAAAQAFCGFYVGRADAGLFNDASKVIMARAGERTVITMQNDYAGPLPAFAMVVPVPEVPRREQIRIADARVFERIDAYSAPRLAEYFDPDPCAARRDNLSDRARGALQAPQASMAMSKLKATGVSVEATYAVGEYDIVILSAQQSDGLEAWLRDNGYRIPAGASRALAPYVRQGMKFFVAKVNLAEQARLAGAGEGGARQLRPLQFTFRSEKFMLPIRLGMLNARGPQELLLWVLTRQGRVEASNYRTLKLPANMDLPVGVRGDFPRFYKSLFAEQARRESHRVVFTEYFWDMSWCDPCAADPLSPEELREAGVFWLEGGSEDSVGANMVRPRRGMAGNAGGGAQPVMLTRLHLRYTRDTFPEDLSFQETRDRQNYQARYVLRHAWRGDPDACPEARSYLRQVRERREREAQALANLTGWDVNEVRERYGMSPTPRGLDDRSVDERRRDDGFWSRWINP